MAAAAMILEKPRVISEHSKQLPSPSPPSSSPPFLGAQYVQPFRSHYVSEHSLKGHSMLDTSSFSSAENSPQQKHHKQYKQQQQQQYPHIVRSHPVVPCFSKYDETLRDNSCFTASASSCSSFTSAPTVPKNRTSGHFTFIVTNSTLRKVDIIEVKKSFSRSQTFGSHDDATSTPYSKMEKSKNNYISK